MQNDGGVSVRTTELAVLKTEYVFGSMSSYLQSYDVYLERSKRLLYGYYFEELIP